MSTPQWNKDELQKEVKRQQYTEQVEQELPSGKECNDIEKLWEITADLITMTAKNVFLKSKTMV